MKKTIAALAVSLALAQPVAFADEVWTALEEGPGYQLSYPVYENDDPEIKENINADIYTRASKCADAAGGDTTTDFRYNKELETDDLINFTFTAYQMNKGAAHGLYHRAGVVYDKHTGHKIPLSHFVNVTVDDLVRLQNDGSHFLAWNKDILPQQAIQGTPKRVPEDYVLTEDGRVLVIFQIYELACYAVGPTYIDVTPLME